MLKRTILSSGEELPVIGLGTWQQFDVHSQEEINNLTDVLNTMHSYGGRLIDSSPMYRQAETMVGITTQASGQADDFFYATKIWTIGGDNGIQQVRDSLKKM